MTGRIIGPHIIGPIGPHLGVLGRWQPRMALLLDPDADGVRALRAVCPHTTLIGRIYRPDGEISQRILADPAGAARWAHGLAMANGAVAAGLLDYVQITNEVCQFWDALPALNSFELERMRLAQAAGRYRCAILGFSVGNPDLPAHDRMALWRRVYPAIAQAETGGHCVALHQYGAPDLWGPAALGGSDWLLHRLEHQVLPRLPFQRVRFAVTEFGIDGLLLDSGGGPAGWQQFTDAAGYARQLTAAGSYLEQFSERVLGYAVFTLGHNPPWGSYDISGEVAELLAQAPLPGGPEPEPEPPPQGGGMERNIKVYDTDGSERSFAWLQGEFRVELLEATTSPAYILKEVCVTEGPTVAIAHVVNELPDSRGLPMSSVAVAWSWPDAQYDMGSPETQAFLSRWRPRADIQFTDGNGMTGFGIGQGSYYYPAHGGGPHAMWVLHHQYQSDGLAGIGMIGGTNHRGPLRLTFALREVAAPAPVYPDFVSALRGEAERRGELSVNPKAALCRAAKARGLWPVQDEYVFTFDGVDYAAERFRDPDNDDKLILWCVKGDWGRIEEWRYP